MVKVIPSAVAAVSRKVKSVVNFWTLTVPLNAGTNTISIQGLDIHGNLVATATNNITVNYDDPAEIRIISATLNGDSSLKLIWKSQIGKTYQVEYRDDLIQGSWTVLSELQASETASSATDKASLSRNRYYRIQLLSP